jgi:CBS domain-containing protein
MPRTISSLVQRDVPLLRTEMPLAQAVRRVIEARLPALPVVDADDRYAGIFGEREFITALFPGYVGSLRHAGFVPKSIDAVLERRQSCRTEPVSRHMNTEHIEVGPDFSDVGVAEIFIHHRVLIVPVVERRRVLGVITRADFFAEVAQRFLRDPP